MCIRDRDYLADGGYLEVRTAAERRPARVADVPMESLEIKLTHKGKQLAYGKMCIRDRTKGAEKFLRENPSSTVYISMTPSTASLNGVCRALAKALKIGGKHNRMDMMEEVRTRLAGTNKVVICLLYTSRCV